MGVDMDLVSIINFHQFSFRFGFKYGSGLRLLHDLGFRHGHCFDIIYEVEALPIQ